MQMVVGKKGRGGTGVGKATPSRERIREVAVRARGSAQMSRLRQTSSKLHRTNVTISSWANFRLLLCLGVPTDKPFWPPRWGTGGTGGTRGLRTNSDSVRSPNSAPAVCPAAPYSGESSCAFEVDKGTREEVRVKTTGKSFN